jgi:hypothetical protein
MEFTPTLTAEPNTILQRNSFRGSASITLDA